MPVGEFFGSYQLLHLIGSGGAADVYRARHIHPAYENAFAIKILHSDQEEEKEIMAGFRREAYVLSMLQHPNIVQTLEAGVEGGTFFIAMEFIDGRDLRDLLERLAGKPVPLPIALHAMAQILKGLHFAHELEDEGKNLNLVHRDIKPSNILLGFDGSVKVTDFGIATLTGALTYTRPDQVMGTLGYIGPEALAGDSVDRRADVFAAGAIFYEMLCGLGPFDAEDTDVLLRNNSRARATRPRRYNDKIPPELQKIILRSLAKNPNKRYASCLAMLEDLAPYLPSPEAMSLAMAAYCHDIFVDQFVRRMRGGPDKPKAPEHIAMCTRPAFKSILDAATQGQGLRIMAYANIPNLIDALDVQNLPEILIIDVATPGMDLPVLVDALMRLPKPVPVVATAPNYDPMYSAAAYRLGAMDMLVGEVTTARLLSSMSLCLRHVPTAPPTEVKKDQRHRQTTARIALVSSDDALQKELGTAMREWGYEVEAVASASAAIERASMVSHAALIFDAATVQSQEEALHFIHHFRSLPGIAQLPMLYLARPEESPPKLPIRCGHRSRDESATIIANALREVRSAHHLGRIYTRYETDFQVDFRYGGRSFEAQCKNVSRGGLLLECFQLPAVGTQVGIALSLAPPLGKMELGGMVVRTEPPRDSETQPSNISIAFRFASERAEKPLLDLIAVLDQNRPDSMSDDD